jgi:hypothetical protein
MVDVMRMLAWWGMGLGGLLIACNNGGEQTSTFTATVPETTTGVGTSTTDPSTTMLVPTTGEPAGTSTEAPTSTTVTPTTDDTDETGPAPTSRPEESSSGEEESSSGDDSTTGEVCEAPGLLNVCDDGDDVDPFHALGLGCAGAPDNTLPITKSTFASKTVAYTVARGFGTAEDPGMPGKLLFGPREGEKLLIISTGQVGDLNDEGVLVEVTSQYDNANNFNPDNPNALPAPMSPLVGSNSGLGGTPFAGCDLVHDCSDSIDPNWTLGNGDPNDLLFAGFDITVPGGTYGFEFDVAFFSSEYPEFVGDKFNDMFIGWSTSEAYTGNVTFYGDQPFTVTSLAEAMETSGYTGMAPELAGTGFEGYGSTGWTTVSAPAVPGETFTFAFAIMDMGDSSKATVAVLDHWRWSCKGCVPEYVDPLCGTDGHPACCGLCVTMEDDPDCGAEGHPMCCEPG